MMDPVQKLAFDASVFLRFATHGQSPFSAFLALIILDPGPSEIGGCSAEYKFDVVETPHWTRSIVGAGVTVCVSGLTVEVGGVQGS